MPGLKDYKIGYEGRIHYNGDPFAGLHFDNMMQGKSEPFTTVDDAFAAEMVSIGAMRSSEQRRQIDLHQDIVPDNLRAEFAIITIG
jgi:hypothetical protein